MPTVDPTYQAHGDHAPSRAVQEDSLEDTDADTGAGFCPQHRQRQLSRLQDCTRLRRLEQTLRTQCNWDQLERLRELRHPEVSHRWLWHLNSTCGGVLSECDYALNVQKRVGARILEESTECRVCGKHVDPFLEHSEVCATAEATRGHYACVRALVDGLRLADSAVKTEPRELTSTNARP